MTCQASSPALPLAGKKGLITGVANDKSIAYAVAQAIVALGGEVAITYQNDKTARYTQPLAEALGAKLFLKLDVAEPGSLENVVEECGKTFGQMTAEEKNQVSHRFHAVEKMREVLRELF